MPIFENNNLTLRSLLEGLQDPTLKEWHDVPKIQHHWIGDCTGTAFSLQVVTASKEVPKNLNVWTDKAEYMEDAKYILISEKNLLSKSVKSIDSNGQLDIKVVNPFTNQELPVFIKDDFEYAPFRDVHLGIPCASEADKEVAKSLGVEFQEKELLNEAEALKKREEIMLKARELKIGGYPLSSKLRDWLISRQRYWGTPIPIIHCKNCGAQPVPREELPVKLPKASSPSEGNKRSLRDLTDWINTKCPKCSGDAHRELDTMDTFVDSSWYYLRYLDAKNDREMFDKEIAAKQMPVDLYIGGKEHGEFCLLKIHINNYLLPL